MGFLGKTVLAVFMVVSLCCAALSAGPPKPEGAAAVKTGTVSGQFLTTKGEPLAGGMVYFFDTKVNPPPAYDKYWRVPDFIKPLDGEGKFFLDLPEGNYYLGAIKRFSGKAFGPPREGDYFFVSVDDTGALMTYRVKSDTPVILGRIPRAEPFRSSTVEYGKGVTAIEGIILDDGGKPVENAIVFAFVSPAAVGKPLLTSYATGKDGTFVLRVHDSGTFYLKVRNVYGGGPPVPGETIGAYGEKEPVAVTVGRGERLTGITINVKKFSGRGPQGGKK